MVTRAITERISSQDNLDTLPIPVNINKSIMSDLQRQFAKAKLSGLPFDPPMPAGYINEENEDDDYAENDDLRPLPEPSAEDDSSSASSASSASSTGTIRPSPSKHLFARPKGFVLQIPFSTVLYFYFQ